MSEGSDNDESRTEDPSERRKEQAIEKGQIAYSREVGSTLGILTQFFLLFILGGWLYEAFSEMMKSQIMTARPWLYGSVPVFSTLMPALKPVAIILLLFFTGGMLGPIIGHLMQKGPDPKPEAAMPELGKIDPISGVKRFFSKEMLLTLGRNVVRTVGLMLVAYKTIAPHTEEIVYAAAMPFTSGLSVYAALFGKLFLNSLMFLAAVAAIDYFIQWRIWYKGLMMTRQELKDEMKEMEGNPQIKQKVRQIQQERSKRKIEKQVPKATVVVTNPTHFAVALKYSRGETPVPKVVAKGTDFLAQKIKDIARQNGVPVIANPPLARMLYREVKPGKDIPMKFYKAVAKIIATVFRMEQVKKEMQESRRRETRLMRR